MCKCSGRKNQGSPVGLLSKMFFLPWPLPPKHLLFLSATLLPHLHLHFKEKCPRASGSSPALLQPPWLLLTSHTECAHIPQTHTSKTRDSHTLPVYSMQEHWLVPHPSNLRLCLKKKKPKKPDEGSAPATPINYNKQDC